MSDADNLNGGLRNWVLVQGSAPTLGQYESYRSNPTYANALSIWGKATASGNPATGGQTWSTGIIGYWAFTSDPRAGHAATDTTGATEPDVSGNGITLTYFNGSSDAGGVLPQLLTCLP